MEVMKNGKFSITISSDELATGLRKVDSNQRNNFSMTVLSGMVGKDKALRSLTQMARIDTDVITDNFPYPQLFILSNHILVCGRTKIYEYVGDSLSLKITVAMGLTWRVLDFVDYICLSNGVVTVVRDSQTGTYSEVTTLPTFGAACDFNGQVMLGPSDISTFILAEELSFDLELDGEL